MPQPLRHRRGGRRARASTLRGVTVVLLLSAGLGCGRASPAPDVVLITIDTLRADFLSSYGFERRTSPFLDRVAADGVLFERAIAASAATTPSHASIMTSRYPREHSIGHSNGGTRLTGTTLAEVFRDAGYATAAFVGNLVLERRTGFDRGFDHYDDEFDRREANRAYFERRAESTTRAALAWLADHTTEPVFLWVHYQDPHGPYVPPADERDRFALDPWPGDAPLQVVPRRDGRDGIPRYQALDGLNRPHEYRSRYAGEIHYTDRWIGRLLEGISVAARDPILLVTADHGESLGEHGRYFVHFFTSTPENAHVPFVLRAPGLPSARRSETVSHVDVMPTLLELAGLEGPSDMHGIALGPFLRDGRPLPDRAVYCDTGSEVSVYRDSYFVRVMNASPAAGATEGRRRTFAYAWPSHPGAAPAVTTAELRPETLAYLDREPPEAPAPLLDADTRERLRAIGYEP